MYYYNPIVSKEGFIHSIDMVYVEYFSRLSPNCLLEELRALSRQFPSVRYDEHLGRPRHSKYDFYLDGVVFGGAYIDMGKYTDYNKETKEFHLLPMFQLRVNPNKYMHELWFQTLLKTLLQYGSSGRLRKYDYAVDIPLKPALVDVFKTKKERGLYKGTRYFGQAGRHNYCKIYDKQADMKRQGSDIEPLTRVEHTLFSGKEVCLEQVYVLSNNVLKDDLSDLNDTDRAIVTMYRELKALGSDYKLDLGRRKMEKLKDYIIGDYVVLEYGDALHTLIENIKIVFDATDSIADDGMFMQVDDDCELPFD